MQRLSITVAALLLTCTTAHAVPISLFSDVDTYIERAQDIVIAKCISVPEKGPESFSKLDQAESGLPPVGRPAPATRARRSRHPRCFETRFAAHGLRHPRRLRTPRTLCH
jgi:hypothetical protein